MRKSRLLLILLALATATGVQALDEQSYLSTFLQSHPTQREAWNRMVSAMPASRWLKNYVQTHGAESPATVVKVGNEAFSVFSTCKPHDCFTTFAVVFSPDGKSAWGALADYGKEPKFFGSPAPSVAQALRTVLDSR
jgi:hypothetical protein